MNSLCSLFKNLCLSGILTLFVTCLHAQYTLSDADVVVINGTITSCSYNFDSTYIIIPSTLDGQTVTGIGSTVYSNVFSSRGITRVTLPSTIDTIGERAFYNNPITDVNIDECTALQYIGGYAFIYNRLTQLDLSGCSSLTTIGTAAFHNGTIETLNINALSLEKIGASAFGYNEITAIDLSGNTSVHSIGQRCFVSNAITSVSLNGCSVLEEIGEEAFSNNYVDTVDFTGCSSLTIIHNSAFERNSVAWVDLSPCTSLDTIGNRAFISNVITHVNLNTCANLKWIGEAAFQYNQIDSLNLSGCTGLQTIETYAFQGHLLGSVDIGSCTSLLFVGAFAFNGDYITSLNLPVNSNYPAYGWKSSYGIMYSGGSAINDLTLFYYVPAPYTLTSNDVVVTGGAIQSCSYDFTLKNIIIPSFLDGQTVTGIANGVPGNGVFQAKQIFNVTLPESIETIGNYAFTGNSIDSINLNVCSGLLEVGHYAFQNNDMTTLAIDSCTQLTSIGNEAFSANDFINLDLSHCESLRTIGEFSFSYGNIQSIDLSNCVALDSIYIGAFEANSIDSLGIDICANLSYLGPRSFSYNNLDTIVLDSNTQLTFIGTNAFANNGMAGMKLPTPQIADSVLLFWLNEDDSYFAGGEWVSNLTVNYDAQMSPVYSVQFTVTDGGVPIPDAEVYLNGFGISVTDQSGIANYEDIIPQDSIPYTVVKDVYDTAYGMISIVDSDIAESVQLNLTTYNVTFTITDDDPLDGANVTLNEYGTQLTNASGVTTFANVLPGSIGYTVTNTAFNTETGTVIVMASDVAIEVDMDSTTYNVNFTVTEGTEPVEGASILLAGYSVAVTNASGIGTVNGVLPRSDMSYEITRNDYNTVNGTITVTDSDVDETIIMNLTTHSVTFTVTDGTDPLESAEVTFTGYGSMLTDAMGIAIFENVLPEANIDYDIVLTGYDLAIGSITVDDADIDENVQLNQTTYNVGFTITDGSNPISGASVLLTGYGSLTTNSSGVVVFEDVAPEADIAYTITASSYNTVNGVVTVTSSNVNAGIEMELTRYDVTFEITDGASPVEDVQVELNGYGMAVTDALGYAHFANVLPGIIDYSITDMYYRSEVGTVVVTDANLTMSVSLTELPSYNVVFTITDGTDPLENATVTLGAYGSLNTNVSGNATFTRILPESNISYTVNYPGYETITGTVIVEDADIAESAELLELITYTVTFIVSDGTTPVENANVELTGYGIVNTNSSGVALFTNVEPESNIAYTVSMLGYETSAGTVTVVNTGISEGVTIAELIAYDVTFTITDGSDPIEDATVSLTGYGTSTSNASGIALFNYVEPESDITYTVSADDYDTESGTVTVVNANVNEAVQMSLTTYEVSIAINDGTDPIAGATVNLTGYGSTTTNGSGVATFTNVIPGSNINYSAEASGYSSSTGSVTVTNANVSRSVSLMLNTYSVNFSITNGINPIAGANVTLAGYGDLTTNASGNASFSSVAPATDIEYTIAYTAYNTETGTITVSSSDVNIGIQLDLTTYSISFTVINGTYPIEGAIVSLAGYGSYVTNASGQLSFSNIEPEADIAYSVSAVTYEAVAGSVTVTNTNQSVNIEMELSTYSVEFIVSDGLAPIQGANVALAGYGNLITDAFGVVSFTDVLPEDNIFYAISHNNYATSTGNITVDNENVNVNVALSEIPSYTVNFTVTSNGSPVVSALVSLSGYGTILTDETGVAIFNNVFAENDISYSITRDGYVSNSGAVAVVDQDIENVVSLDIVTYYITFEVTNGTEPIEGATIWILDYDSITTNASGIVVIEVLPVEDLNYFVEAEGYVVHYNSITVSNENVSVTVELSLPVLYAATFTITDGANPVEGAVIDINGYGIQITDADGQAEFVGFSSMSDHYYTVYAAGYLDYNGVFSVIVSDIEETVILSVTSLQEDKQTNISMYPNPASDYVTLQLEQDAVVSMYTSASILVHEQKVFNGLNTVLLGEFKPGIYSMLIRTRDRAVVKSLVIR